MITSLARFEHGQCQRQSNDYFFEYGRSGIAGKNMLYLHSHQQCKNVPLSSYLHQCLLSGLFDNNHSDRWEVIVPKLERDDL